MADTKKEQDKAEEYGTTGHEWDGIREYDTPMPRWWLWTFYATIVWAVIYVILFPAIPLVNGATPGLLGFSTRGQLAEEMQAARDANAEIDSQLVAAELTEISADPELQRYAMAGGAAVFKTYCAQCHGAGAAGVQAAGYPNLLDDDWLWGGDIEAIHQTITHGIRWEADPDTRFSQMPAFGEILEGEEIDALTAHVLAISGQDHDAGLAATGAELYAENCASCHGDAGMGDREQGAPNLTDAIWLYGGSEEEIHETITYSRYGIMPPWQDRLTEAQIRQVSAYVHGLGGGE
ncbi:cytochrome-c oxidase, cbb3-type subunit III [Oceanomicrobium pacificus]|uniref:Cbb3-type cytochrome c oxidase subunit n=1 Tax=Oceanomicrobium pacificus TaxID=2692916 RepID=A0A6B0TWP4_9RHOB|nr:cytochrome-c oxidase, cbb3-type subunit III [Oceanomicrobium pacificus]MXU65574.1 cytochrome-c oxidase, cbb3-type subunit III [Oceanomicrobium pacificus]